MNQPVCILITADRAMLPACVSSDSYVRVPLLAVWVNKGSCGNKRYLLSSALFKGFIYNLFEVDQLLSSINTICMFKIEKGREVGVVWVWTGGWIDGWMVGWIGGWGGQMMKSKNLQSHSLKTSVYITHVLV